MIPIEKNIIVTDVEGNHIGTTYPKRARGLVKNGRAEYVSDREIRLKDTRAPAVYTYTEDTKMSKVINFNTRDFKFEDTCKSNVGFRGFVSTGFGNEEIWEIGDWGWNWTQIYTELTGLDKNTDYVFRFAMTLGHNDDNREESLVHIFRSYPDSSGENSGSRSLNVANKGLPEECINFIHSSPNAEAAERVLETGIFSVEDVRHICDTSANPDEAVKRICDGFRIRMVDNNYHTGSVRDDIENARKQAWDERYTYCIRQSRFKPVISKRDREEDTMLRVFELPFNTGDSQNWKVVIVSNHAIARFFRAKENEAYSGLEDLSYEQWRRQRTERLYAEREQEKLAKLEAARRARVSAGTPFGNEFNADMFGTGEKADPESGKNSLGSLKLSASIIHDPEIMEKLISLAKMGLNIEFSGTTVGNKDEDGSEEESDEDIDIDEDFDADEDIDIEEDIDDDADIEEDPETGEEIDDDFDEESEEDDGSEEDEDDTSEDSDDEEDYEASQYSRCEMTEEQFAYFLAGCEDGRVYGFKDFTVNPGSSGDVNVNIGRPLDGWMISFTDVTMTASAFSMLIAKIGDGCFMKFKDFTVTGAGTDHLFVYNGMKADGFAVQIKDATIPRKLVEMLNARKGDGCNVSLKDVTLVG